MSLANVRSCPNQGSGQSISANSSVSPIFHRHSNQPCSGCSPFSIDKLTKSASISLKDNHFHLDKDRLLREYEKTPPIFLNFQRIRQARSSCPLCLMIFTETHEKISIDTEALLAYRCEDLNEKVESVWIYDTSTRDPLVKVYCHASEGSYASQHLVYRPISPPGSEMAISRIKCWIQGCIDNHPECLLAISGTALDNTPVLPTRILDVRDYPSSLRLVISDGRKAKYVALSHCWGGKPQLRTTKETLVNHQKHISCGELSETIRNAAWVTKKLDVCYLWVDCLCIIQEDEDDFDRESRRMASVYENSYVTIAATGARDGSGGLFLRSPQGTYVEVPCDAEDPKLGFMYFGLQKKPEETIFEAPLNRRGWVLQEHLFARRTLHFAPNQLYWECYKTFVGEDNTEVTNVADMAFPNRAFLCYVLDGLRGFHRNPKSEENNEMNNVADIYSIWAHLIRYYSTRGLTDPNDKLPAILSLSLELERILGHPFHFNEGLLFGSPYFELQGLLWRAEWGASLQRPAHRRAPSWSWASVDGAIDFVDLVHDNRSSYWFVDLWHPCKNDLKVLGVRAHQAPGMPSCKALLLNGTTLECFTTRCVTSRHDGQHNNNQLACVYTEKGDCIDGELEYDVADDRPDRVWLVPIFVRWRSEEASSPVYYCLMAKKAVDHPFKDRVFERVGVGMIFDVKWVFRCERGFLVLV